MINQAKILQYIFLLLSGLSLSFILRGAALDELWQASLADRYRSPSTTELVQAEDLFLRQLAGERSAALRRQWAELGFIGQTITTDGQRFAVVREQASRRGGRGFYAFALDRGGSAILQAPHGLKDLHTGTIALRLLTEGPFAAGAWNTTARRYRVDGRTVSADMAHRPASYFLAFTRAVIRHDPRSPIIQLHGFNRQKRTSETAGTAAIILSNGSRYPTGLLVRTAHCLNDMMADPVLIYPWDVAELGGTRNIIGRTLRMLNAGAFFHVELNLPTRRLLLEQTALRRSFARCFTEQP